MPENIEWARPERTTVWSFEGRLYRSKATAMVQWKHRTETKENAIRFATEQGNTEKREWWENYKIAPVYEVTWVWREFDDGEYT